MILNRLLQIIDVEQVANPAFHRAMPVKLFGRMTSKLFNVMDATDGQNLDWHDLMSRWALDIIGLAGFGMIVIDVIC